MGAPPVVRPAAPEVAQALGAGAVVALPAADGYYLVVRAGAPGDEDRVEVLARRLPGGSGEAAHRGPHYLVGDVAAVRALADDVPGELVSLLTRCWPGPLDVAVHRGGAVVTVGQPEGRLLRRLCRDLGPWRAATLGPCTAPRWSGPSRPPTWRAWWTVPHVTARRPRCSTPPSTPLCVAREGALPATYIEAAMLMGGRRRWFKGRQARA